MTEDNHFEIERKFLIEYPDVDWLEGCPDCHKSEIVQTYLESDPDEEIRVRRREACGNTVFYKTVKRRVTDIRRIEIEDEISKEEYYKLLANADGTKRPIKKTRYCLAFFNQLFEIDVYPFWSDKAIVEIELRSEDVPIVFPEKIKVIKEVTGEEEYKNSSLAKI